MVRIVHGTKNSSFAPPGAPPLDRSYRSRLPWSAPLANPESSTVVHRRIFTTFANRCSGWLIVGTWRLFLI